MKGVLPLDYLPSRLTNLAFNVALAAEVPGLDELRALFGDRRDYDDLPQSAPAEFSADLAHGSSLARRIVALHRVGVLPQQPKTPSGPLQDKGVHQGPYGRERWLYINGVMASAEAAESNASALGALFRRPVSVLYNTTQGLVLDLLESVAGKSFGKLTEAVDANIEAFVHALCDDSLERLILVSHSQGTIITSVLLKTVEEWLDPVRLAEGAGTQKLSPERHMARKLSGKSGQQQQPERSRRAQEYALQYLRREHLARLECYCFANCCTSLTPVARTEGPLPRHTPWLESYGNERDLVARLGLLAPPHGIGSARIEGDRYRRDAAWGHLLNVHYLARLQRELERGALGLKPFPQNLLQTPRLLDYLDGQAPASAYP